MSDRNSLNSIDSLLCQSALQIRELSQEKNELIQRIKVCRDDIAERLSHIDALRRNIRRLEEETRVKQKTVMQNKTKTKSMKETNRQLFQYALMLKIEVERKKNYFDQEISAYGERIASYRQRFMSHQEYYYKNPMAQKLLGLQAEKEEIEGRIKACDHQITMKQAELDHLTDPVVIASSTDTMPDSVSGQQLLEETEKQLDPQTLDSGSAADSFCLVLNQTKMLQSGHEVSVEARAADVPEEQKVQGPAPCSTAPEEAGRELWPRKQLDEQYWTEEMQADEQEKETGQQQQRLEQQCNVSEAEEAVEDKAGEGTDEARASSETGNEEPVCFSHEEIKSLPSLANTTAAPTAAFPFSFSPASSPHRGSSDSKSPAFLFSLNSDPGTPGFSGFGFDSPQAEDTNFAFAGPFFNEKRTTDTQSSTGSEFLFDQQEQGEDFQFAFNFKGPQATNKDKSKDEFPFSFQF